MNLNNSSFFILIICVIVGTNYLTYNKIDKLGDKQELTKLSRALDSLKKVNNIIAINLFNERKVIKRITKQDSLLVIKINNLEKQDNTLASEQAKVFGSYSLLTQHQLLDSLHNFYAKNH